MTSSGRRRLDRVLEPDFLADVSGLSLSDVRARRDEAREEEEILSFVRRWLHGKLDILRSELVRRHSGSESDDDMLASLKVILADAPSTGRRGARSGMPSERLQSMGRRSVERIAAQDHLARLPELTDEQIERLVEDLVDEEKAVSEQRRRLHVVIDVLSDELSRRYRNGSATVEEILGSRTGGHKSGD